MSRYAGEFEHVFEASTAGVTLQAPQLDINTVAAGGGSRLFFRLAPTPLAGTPQPFFPPHLQFQSSISQGLASLQLGLSQQVPTQAPPATAKVRASICPCQASPPRAALGPRHPFNPIPAAHSCPPALSDPHTVPTSQGAL